MIKLKDILNETPVDTHQTIGDFSRGHSFTNKVDRALITNPVVIQKVKDFFKNTSATFDFYFVNTKEARSYTEVGRVTEAFIFDNLKIKPEQLKDGRINKDNITVFFTNNKGAEKIVLTPWIIAHRFGHVIRRDPEWDQYLNPWVDERLKEILNCYGISEIKFRGYSYGDSGSGNYNNARKYRLAKRHLCETIGTFKSARDKNLREEFEFQYELFAQYLNSGKVKFNPLPEILLTGHAVFGRKEYKKLNDPDAATSELESLRNDYPDYAEQVLSGCIGNIYLM